MKRLLSGCGSPGFFLMLTAFSIVANAQATRTWVSGVGDDVNPCSRTAPCKTFAGAISKTAAGGEINCLDPGGFGSVTITKSIIIDCHGTLGSILHSTVQGIVINAAATDDVTIRNLSINGAGTTFGTNGINVLQAKLVNLENLTLNNDSNAGIQVSPSAATIKLVAQNVTISDAANGIILNGTTAAVNAHLQNVRVMNAGTDGIRVGVNSHVVVVDCMFSNNGVGLNLTAAGSDGIINRSTFAGNATGVQVSGAALAFTSNVMRHNAVSLSNSGGLIATDGNNFLGGSPTTGVISSGTVSKI